MEEYDILVDDDDAGTIYVGKASRLSATSNPVWQIKKIDETSNPTEISYAGGSARFDQIWDNRASLTYRS